jgi:hypothetical protein
MKAFLLYKDQDFEVQQELSANDQTLAQDFELDTLCNGMALGDEFIFSVVKRAVLSGVSNDLDTILYRQAILRDCLKNPLHYLAKLVGLVGVISPAGSFSGR